MSVDMSKRETWSVVGIKMAFSLVHSRLGHKLQGVLCDGDSAELAPSTVVNCMKIDEGMLGSKTRYVEDRNISHVLYNRRCIASLKPL